MDNLTHTLTAVAIARAGGSRFGPYATGILVLACNAPDIDVVSALGGSASYLNCHRGYTHSFAAAPLLAAAITAIFVLGRRLARSQTPFSPTRAFLLALSGVVLGHLFLDWGTNYGIRLLLPFSPQWLAWDAVPILDIWLLLALIAGLTLPFLFGLIGEEIGAHTRGNRGGAIFALVFLVCWFGLRGICHQRAVAVLESRLYHGLEPRQVAAFADFTNPFLWHGVVATSETWELANLNLFEDFDPARTRTYYPPEPSPMLAAARQTYTAQVFLRFARFPFSYVEPAEGGFRVIFRDLRFEDTASGAKNFVVQILEDRSLRVREESFHFRPPSRVR